MEIYRIEPKNASYYKDFLPLDFQDLLFREEFIKFSILDEQKDATYPAGLMIVSVSDNDSFTVEWLYIDESYRGCGLGDMFLSFLMDFAMKEKRSRIYLKNYRFEDGGINDDKTLSDTSKYPVEDWLYDRDFMKIDPPMVDKIYSYEFLNRDLVFKKQPECKDVKSFYDLSENAILPEIEKIVKKYGKAVAGSIDLKLSFAYCKDNNITSSLIVRRYGNIFVPLKVQCIGPHRDKKQVIELILSFLRNSDEFEGDEKYLHLTCSPFDPLSGIDCLFEENEALYAEYLEAPSDAYERVLDSVKYDMRSEKSFNKRLEAIPDHVEISEIEYLSGVTIDN